MSESPDRWVGQTVDAKFPLRQFLGGTNHSAVFLTQLPGTPAQAAALKLIQVSAASTNLQLSRWRAASQLSHPNLLRIFEQGTCGIAGMNFLYVITEHAPEDLSQILPLRPLTPEETREMLPPVLDALAYLHEKNLVHGHITPANILAIDNKVKLSSDSIFHAGESRIDSREVDIYDAPELASSSASAPADVWSLGTTLVEVLTQKPPVRQDALQIDPLFPQDLSEPFLEIVRRSQCLDPSRRWTIGGIATHLNPKPAPAAAVGASPAVKATGSTPMPSPASLSASGPPPSPLAVPLSNVPPRPAAKLPKPKPYSAPQEFKLAPQTPRSRPRFVLPAIAAVLFLAALFGIAKFLNHRNDTSASLAPVDSVPHDAPASPAKSDLKRAQPKSQIVPTLSATSAASPSAGPPAQPASKKERIGGDASVNAATPAVVPPRPTAAKVPAASLLEKPVASRPDHGEVLDQVLPQVSDKARATIHGKVRVAVKVHVDVAGNVSAAEFDNAGPSKFFADLALQAARRWEFTSPELDGHSVRSVWHIRFEFSPSDTKAFPRQEAP